MNTFGSVVRQSFQRPHASMQPYCVSRRCCALVCAPRVIPSFPTFRTSKLSNGPRKFLNFVSASTCNSGCLPAGVRLTLRSTQRQVTGRRGFMVQLYGIGVGQHQASENTGRASQDRRWCSSWNSPVFSVLTQVQTLCHTHPNCYFYLFMMFQGQILAFTQLGQWTVLSHICDLIFFHDLRERVQATQVGVDLFHVALPGYHLLAIKEDQESNLARPQEAPPLVGHEDGHVPGTAPVAISLPMREPAPSEPAPSQFSSRASTGSSRNDTWTCGILWQIGK